MRPACAIAALACATSCGAARNPSDRLEPSPWQPPASSAASNSTGATSAVLPSALAVGDAGPRVDANSITQPSAAAKAPATAEDVKAAVPAPAEPIVATVAGSPIYVSELLAQWLYTDPLQVREHLDNLTLHRLVLAEAKRLGVRVAPEQLSKQYDRAIEAIEERIRRSDKRRDMKLDTFVDRVLGLDPIRYREIVRDDALRMMLGERAARAWMLASEHAWTHVIAVKTEADVQAVQADLAAGAAFEEVAEKRSIDASAKQGGRAPGVVKSETAMGKLAFQGAIGAVVGPVFEAGAWLFLRADERPTPLVGDWSVVGPAVEASLAKTPSEPVELAQWRAAMDARYEIDPRPFLKLVGQ